MWNSYFPTLVYTHLGVSTWVLSHTTRFLLLKRRRLSYIWKQCFRFPHGNQTSHDKFLNIKVTVPIVQIKKYQAWISSFHFLTVDIRNLSLRYLVKNTARWYGWILCSFYQHTQADTIKKQSSLWKGYDGMSSFFTTYHF